MAGTVTFNGTNVTLAESGDSGNWDDDGSGPGSAQSADLPIQGSEARGRRVDNADKGSSYDTTTGQDLSSVGTHVGYWLVSLQPNLTTRGSVKLGGGIDAETSPNYRWDRFDGSNPYPPRGGWQRVYLDVERPADATTGTLNLSSVRQFGHLFNMGDVGGTTPNVQQDRTDYLSGGGIYVTLDAGTAPSPATIDDVVTADPGNTSNAYGCVTDDEQGVGLHARLGIGDATATVFNSDGEDITGGVQTLAAKDWIGITVDLQNASTDVDFANAVYKAAPAAPGTCDFKGLATSGACDFSGYTFKGLRLVQVNSAFTFADHVFQACGEIDPVNGDYTGQMDLPGTDEYVDTQENIDLNTTSGDFEVIMHIEPDDWTPASIEALASHYGGTIATESFRLQLLTTGAIRLIVSDGTSETTLDSTAISAENGWPRWIRVEYDQSAGQADHFYSRDPKDTPVGDIAWTANGTPSGTSRSMPTNSRAVLLGAENDGTPASFFDGRISYFELWTDGFRTTGASEGDLRLLADWRTGPDFTGSPATRVDDFDGSNFTWEEQGTAPVYTQGDNFTSPANLSGSVVRNSTAEGAIRWTVNDTTPTELDNIAFTSSGTGHALVLGIDCPSTMTLTGHTYSGYAGSDGNTGNETIWNNSGKAITITVTGDSPSVRNGTGASTTIVTNPVNTTITVRDENDSALQNARVVIEAGDGTGDLPFEDTVTITRSGATASVSHTAHGLNNGDKVVIRGANEQEYNGVSPITNVSANAYDYTVSGSPDTPATGTITSTGVVVEGLTNASGQVTASRSYSVDQNARGRIRKATGSPRYKSFPPGGFFTDVVDKDTGLAKIVNMIRDD